MVGGAKSRNDQEAIKACPPRWELRLLTAVCVTLSLVLVRPALAVPLDELEQWQRQLAASRRLAA